MRYDIILANSKLAGYAQQNGNLDDQSEFTLILKSGLTDQKLHVDRVFTPVTEVDIGL